MKWRNVPIPEAHVIGIVGVIFLHLVFPLKIFAVRWPGHILGWLFIIQGICLAGWSVIEADAINIDSPNRLITSGPYARSRNPMYLAWTIMGLGTAFVINTVWLAAILPIVALYTHFRVILPEESFLDRRFGYAYREYCQKVRRYL